jgi:hypothetical protein
MHYVSGKTIRQRRNGVAIGKDDKMMGGQGANGFTVDHRGGVGLLVAQPGYYHGGTAKS